MCHMNKDTTIIVCSDTDEISSEDTGSVVVVVVDS